MFIENIKQIYTNLTAAVNQILSRLFNDGALISADKMSLIMAGFALLILLTCLLIWFWLRKRSLKNKAPQELSGRDKEKRLAQLEKERAKELELHQARRKIAARKRGGTNCKGGRAGKRASGTDCLYGGRTPESTGS